MRWLSETANSGIFVSESLSSGQPISVRRDTLVAFVGAAPRGPVGIPVAIGSVDEYLKRFGAPGHDGALFDVVCQYFATGAQKAIVVRVCSSARRHRITLPGPEGALTLQAVNPGPREWLRASVDYDGLAPADSQRFNLVVHRLAAPDRPIVERQEIYRGLSVDLADAEFVGHALLSSELVTVADTIPGRRPDVTFRSGIEVGAAYVYVDPAWPEAGGLTDYDLIGCNTEGTGLFALDQLPSIDIVCLVPDSPDPGPVALFTAERYCRRRNAMLLVDPPAHWRHVDDVIRASRESGFASPNVMTYFPRSHSAAGRTNSSIGVVAGALAGHDARDGVWMLADEPALAVRGRNRPVTDLDHDDRLMLKRAGINALCSTGPGHLVLTGLVTMNRGGGCEVEWDDLRLRRMILFIIESIARGTRWAAFQPNDGETRAALRGQISRFMRDLFDAGALAGASQTDAAYVACDSPVDATEPGVSFVVGFAPRGHAMQCFRFHQQRLDCSVVSLHVEQDIALAG